MTFDVALILLYDRSGRILLQHRTDDAPVLPGHWAFFGGRLQEAETPREAVVREAKEELDYDVRDPHLVMTYKFQENGSSGRLYVFSQQFDESPSVLRLLEGKGWGWFDAAGIKPLKMVRRDKEILKAVWAHLGDNSGGRHAG